MQSRTTFFLAILVLSLGAVIAILDRGAPDEAEPAAMPSLVPLEPEQIQTWSLSRESLYVLCIREQGRWMLRKPVAARADGNTVDRMLAVLTRLPRLETVTAGQLHARSLSLAQYGLDKPQARLTLGDGRASCTLAVGALSALKDSVYVQVDDADAVVATSTNLLGVLPRAASDVRDPRLVPGAPAYVKQMSLKRFGGPLIELVREGSEWIIRKPVLARADWARANGLLDQLFALQVRQFIADRIADPSIYGLSDDEAVLQVHLWQGEDGGAIRLAFGRAANEKGDWIYSSVRGEESVAAVSRTDVDALEVDLGKLRDPRLYFLAPSAVAWIRLEDGEQALQLEKGAGGVWQLTEPVQWKAEPRLAEDLVSRLNSLRIEGFVAGTNLPALGLAPPARVIRAAAAPPTPGEAAPGAAAAAAGRALMLSRPQPGSEHLYAKFEDEDQVYRVSAAAANLAIDPIVYRDSVALALDPQAVTRITLRKQGREQAVTREAGPAWMPAPPLSGPVDAAAIAAVLELAAALRVVRYERAPSGDLALYGLAEPRAALTFGLSGQTGIQKTVLLGADSEDLGVYGMVQGQDVLWVLGRDAADRLLRDMTR